MPTVSKNNDVITVIGIFSVEPSRQQELVDSLIDFVETAVKKQPGFVSASIHKSLDGVRVANYAQWRSHEDYEAFANNSSVQSLGQKLSEFPKPDSHVYEIVISTSKPEGSTLKITTEGFLAVFGEFRLKPENQQRLMELEREDVVKAMANPGLMSANFHRALDGTRMVNYSQWRSKADLDALAKQPGFAPESAYWEGLAENEYHIYKVVFTEPTE